MDDALGTLGAELCDVLDCAEGLDHELLDSEDPLAELSLEAELLDGLPLDDELLLEELPLDDELLEELPLDDELLDDKLLEEL